jgi:hypothetical protein
MNAVVSWGLQDDDIDSPQSEKENRKDRQRFSAVRDKTTPGNDYNLSILAARIKSLSVRPLILCVHVVTSALPQESRMSG